MFQHLNGEPMAVSLVMVNKQSAFSFIDDSLEPLWNSDCKRRGKSKQIINLGGIEEISINEAFLQHLKML